MASFTTTNGKPIDLQGITSVVEHKDGSLTVYEGGRQTNLTGKNVVNFKRATSNLPQDQAAE